MSRVRWWKRYDEMPVVELQKSNPVRFGVVVIVITAIVVYFGFTKHIPFKHGFRLKAAFGTAVNISPKSPVRVAGVNVGNVTSIQREGNTGVVTMEISKGGLPIHRDATLKISARILLEGNWFVDLQPGTPSSPTVSSGYTIPITQTSDPVQLDQILDALNTNTRSNLQTFLAEYGAALTRKPTPAENAEQNPAVRGLNAAQALKKTYYDSPQALKGGAIVKQAFGGVEQNDLSKLISGSKQLFAALNLDEQQLGEWVDNFNTFLGAFADQSASLTNAVALLPSTLHNASSAFRNFNSASPAIRKFSLDFIPGVEQTPATIRAAFPWIEQTQASFAPSRARRRSQGLARSRPHDRRSDHTAAGLLQTGRPVLSMPEQDTLPGRQHQAAGRRQHFGRGSLQGVLVLDGWTGRPRSELRRQRSAHPFPGRDRRTDAALRSRHGRRRPDARTETAAARPYLTSAPGDEPRIPGHRAPI